MRRNFLVPIPSFESFEALNAYLERRCLEADGRQAQGTYGDHRPSDGAGPGRPVAAAASSIRRLREAGGPGEFPVDEYHRPAHGVQKGVVNSPPAPCRNPVLDDAVTGVGEIPPQRPEDGVYDDVPRGGLVVVGRGVWVVVPRRTWVVLEDVRLHPQDDGSYVLDAHG